MILLFLATGLLYTQTALAQGTPAPAIPERAGYLTDQTGLLKPSEVQRLEASLQQVQRQTGAAIYILLVGSAQPTDIVVYTHQVADAWGLKVDASKDKWVFIVVAVKDGGINIADSQAIRTTLLDAELRLILDQQMKPAFEAGKLADGLMAGVEAMAQHMSKAAPETPQAPSAQGALYSELLLFALVAVLAVGLYFLVVRR